MSSFHQCSYFKYCQSWNIVDSCYSCPHRSLTCLIATQIFLRKIRASLKGRTRSRKMKMIWKDNFYGLKRVIIMLKLIEQCIGHNQTSPSALVPYKPWFHHVILLDTETQFSQENGTQFAFFLPDQQDTIRSDKIGYSLILPTAGEFGWHSSKVDSKLLK